MRTKTFISLLVTSLAMSAACAKDSARTTTPPPPPPEFEATADAPAPAPTPASEERQDPIMPEDQVLFAFDSAELEPSTLKVLDDVAVWVKADPARAIVVKGHADSSGTVAHNFQLSGRRAETVASYLAFRGVPREQVVIVAVGEAGAVLEPADSNRRVVLYGLESVPPTASR
jgi:OOP family OmpA-OmpF porin